VPVSCLSSLSKLSKVYHTSRRVYNGDGCYTWHMGDEPMVGATAVVRELGIPRSTLYRLVEDGKIPVHQERQPWHKEPRLKFRISEVKAALGIDADSRPR
jgi:hypothetical protein